MDKDIRFTDKKVDESWKAQADKEKGLADPVKPNAESTSNSSKENTTSKPFLNLISSLAYQAMMHLGESPEGVPEDAEVNLEAAKEIIDLLGEVKVKSEGNRSAEEDQVLSSILPELQLKFSKQV